MDLIGSTIGNGRYLIEAHLGGGGMGVVFAAVDNNLGRQVAIKMLAPELARNDQLRSRLRLEGEIQGRLQHSSICPVTDIVDEGPHLGLVMNRLDGQDLYAVVKESGPVDLVTLFIWMRPVLDAVKTAHLNNVVHRDLKPNNIMLVRDGSRQVPVVLDFGIARIVDETRTALTLHGDVAPGTPPFMAPEQFGGGELDHRADIYSLGAVMYYLTTGQLPFRGERSIIASRKVAGEMPPPPSAVVAALPTGFDDLVATAMAPRPDQRFASVEALFTALSQIVFAVHPDAQIDTGPFLVARHSGRPEPAATDPGPTVLPGRTTPQPGGTTVRTDDHRESGGDTAPPTVHRSRSPVVGRTSRRPLIAVVVAVIVLLVMGGSWVAAGGCEVDGDCGQGMVCFDSRCMGAEAAAEQLYRGVIEAYNEADRERYMDAWRFPVECFWRNDRSWSRAEIAHLRRRQFEGAGHRIEIAELDSRLLPDGRVLLEETGRHQKRGGESIPIHRMIIVDPTGGGRLLAEAAPGARCLDL